MIIGALEADIAVTRAVGQAEHRIGSNLTGQAGDISLSRHPDLRRFRGS